MIDCKIKGLDISETEYRFSVVYRIPGEPNLPESIAVPIQDGQTAETVQAAVTAQILDRIRALTTQRTVATAVKTWAVTQPVIEDI